MNASRFDHFNRDPELERQRRAYHESGHAIAALDRELDVTEVSIEGDDPHSEHAMSFDEACDRFGEPNARERFAVVQYAGGIAQRKWQEEAGSYGCEEDTRNAYANLAAIAELIPQADFDVLKESVEETAQAVIDQNWNRIQTLANILLRAGRLNGEQVSAILCLARMLEHGPASDIFRAEQALGITSTIGDYVEAVNESTFAPILVAMQTYAIEQFVLALNKILERPNRQYQLQSLPAIVQFVIDNAEHLPVREPAFLRGLDRIGARIDGLDALDDMNKTRAVMGGLQHVMPTPETNPGLNALKALRDKRLAHPEAIEAERIPQATWEQAESLLTQAKRMMGILGAWTCEAYVDNDGDYLMTYDAEVAPYSLRRMLREIGVIKQ
jgi:hypothetical protein